MRSAGRTPGAAHDDASTSAARPRWLPIIVGPDATAASAKKLASQAYAYAHQSLP
jgi:hypothetical protein